MSENELNKEQLLALYKPYDKIHGPYLGKDGRLRIVLNNSRLSNGTPGKTKTLSYPKALVEIREGRLLSPGETVDHVDRDPLNNTPENLQVLSRSDHVSLDVIRVFRSSVICPICNKEFVPNKDQALLGRPSAGPFCSRSCVGHYGKQVQTTGRIFEKTPITKTYYQRDK